MARMASDESTVSFVADYSVTLNSSITRDRFGPAEKIADSMDYIIHDPLSSGFLFAFCEDHYCSENIRFVREVDKFRDMFASDPGAWDSRNWKVLDMDCGLALTSSTRRSISDGYLTVQEFLNALTSGSLVPADTWPSLKVERIAVLQAIRAIWDEFLTDSGKYQICISSRALQNSMRRIQLLHVYGRNCFAEALIDPVKTLHRDIHPRFLNSEMCRKMKHQNSQLEEPPTANSLKLPIPTTSVRNKYSLYDLRRGDVAFTLRDLIEDRVLYSEFLKYLCKTLSSENLRCIRSINIFKEKLAANDKAGAYDQAWITYRYFVAEGAPYEISMNHIKRKELMRDLASPTASTFAKVEKSAMNALRTHFETYTTTKEYRELNQILLRTSYSEYDRDEHGPGAGRGDLTGRVAGCFGQWHHK